ncbi:hypothetical protein D0Q02_01750 [Micromonospora craniellae]|uniref:Uncharacterized protein n=1 Tax=Micromonospora craniellae TaxID=2294034 RepID=A0A372G5G0_9ACTN|nr:hypothetical protein D0Q02_01750 [Micromonospora craniellae]
MPGHRHAADPGSRPTGPQASGTASWHASGPRRSGALHDGAKPRLARDLLTSNDACMRYDVAVIGSGFGGGVAALRWFVDAARPTGGGTAQGAAGPTGDCR